MRRFYIFFLFLLALSSAINTVNAAVVNVPDTVLAAKLRTTLGLADDADITDTALGGLTGDLDFRISVNSPVADKIVNLTGLEYATGITGLHLDNHAVVNLGPLEELTSLTELILTNNSISDLSPLADLTSLTELWVGGNSISDLGPLEDLTSLTVLWIYDNSISDLSPLEDLTSLTELWANDNSISDLSPLEDLTSLTKLSLSNNSIVDFTLLADLTNLMVLVLSESNITDVTFLAGLTNLTDLELRNNNITDITPLANLVNLTRLRILRNSGLVDYSPLSWLPFLFQIDSDTDFALDRIPLAVRISDVPDETQDGPFDIIVTFSGDVNSFVVDDIELTGTATATGTALEVNPDLVESVWEEYTATIIPTTDGDVIIQVPAEVAEDNNISRNNKASSEYTVSVDVRPTVVVSDVPSDVQSGAFDVTITFSEDVTDFERYEIVFTGDNLAEVTALTGSGSVYTATITPGMDGDIIFYVPADVAEDGNGNGNIASNSHTVSVNVLPAVTISNVPSGVQSGAFSVTITFSEDVTGFTADDIELTGTASASAELIGGNKTYFATITPTTSGVVRIQVPADVVDGGNVASERHDVTVDMSISVTISDVPSGVQSGAFSVTITFGENVTGFTAGDIELTGTAFASAELTGSGSVYTATITPTTDGDIIIRVPADVAEDSEGTGNSTSEVVLISVDVPPTVVISDVPPGVQTGAFDVTITFSEDVTGFESDDIELTGTTFASAELFGSGSVYTATITPTADGDVIIRVPADVAEDGNGNGNLTAESPLISVDVPPTVVISDVPTDVQTGAFDVTIRFSEDVTGFTVGDIELTGTAFASAELTGSGVVYTATITPTTDGDIIIQVPADVANDDSGKGNLASESLTVTVDIPPAVTISDVPTGVQSNAFNVTITFSEEDVTGFESDDIELTGTASASAELTGSSAVYTATITPITSGDLMIQVPAGVAEDSAPNGNTASGRHTVVIDLTRPSVEVTNVPTQTQSGAFDVTITFSEDVTGFESDDISLTGGATAEVSTLTGSDSDYTATITPAADAEGEVTFHVRENAAVDEADKGNTASLSHTVSVDLVPPSVDISGVPTQVTMDTFEVTITFSEDVTGFIADDILLSATASATLSGTGAVYTVTITLVGEITESIIIQVPANVAVDAAGNGNIASIEYRIEAWMPDANLRDIVRDVLGLPVDAIFSKETLLDLTVLDTAEIVLDVENPKIANLTGLEYATELTELYLNEHAISDLRPLATLTQLTKLSLNDNEIENIWHEDSDDNPLENLTELTELSLDDNLIDDLSPLESLAQLTKLSLGGNPIEDISALESLAGLTELSLDRSLIEDITTLEALTQLTKLSLNETPIDDLSPLESLTELTELSLNDNSIDDIFFCVALIQLKILCLEYNEISDVSPLTDLPNLEMLKLIGNPIDDTAPLIGIARGIEADEPIASLISDEALAEILREIFDLDTDEHITYADMKSLTTFEVPDSDITDLSGLEHATELDTLDLRGNTIEDITPLKELTKLTTLDLGVNSISTIDALAGLTELVELSLEENRITDITPLLGLENLEVLTLAGNPIADARPLAVLTDVDIDIDVTMYLVAVPDEGLAAALRDALELEASAGIPSTQLEELTTLDARDRQISDLTGLELATALTELDLRDNTISDVTPLAGLVKLETLRLTGNPIQDASSLTNLTADIEADIVVPGVITDAVLAVAIRETLGLPANTRIIAETLQDLVNLSVREGEIDTLAGLEHAANLTTLEINGGSLTDITPLQTLAELTTLEINSDALTDITPLQALTQLTTLKINGGSITDGTPLQALTQLTILELRDNTITDITPLSELTALTTLDLSGNNISNIEALEGLTALTTLNLSGNSISTIDRLQELTALTTLNLSGNSISSIETLKVLTALTTLNLSGNSISSIETLKVLTALTTLNLSGNSLSSIEALEVLTRLTTLEFADNSLSSIDGLQALTALTTLNLSTNDLSDIQPLQGLTVLKQLSLMSNNISDVLSLAGLVNLEFLRLTGNSIMDTSPLFPLVTTYKLVDVDIEISQWAPWDVNQDGIVNAMDAALVTAAMGQTGETIVNSLTDVNGDGVVDRNDLLLVQEHLDADADSAAPSTDTIVALLGLDTLKSLSRTSLEAELNYLIAETDGSLKYQRAIKFLENFLLALRPNKTRLLANYPNPFNPETWLPYHLANASNVRITIYDTRGAVVRRLDLGHQREGYYTSRSRAAYWDGRNHVGERVASGIYFYELEADDISLLRKMVILK